MHRPSAVWYERTNWPCEFREPCCGLAAIALRRLGSRTTARLRGSLAGARGWIVRQYGPCEFREPCCGLAGIALRRLGSGSAARLRGSLAGMFWWGDTEPSFEVLHDRRIAFGKVFDSFFFLPREKALLVGQPNNGQRRFLVARQRFGKRLFKDSLKLGHLLGFGTLPDCDQLEQYLLNHHLAASQSFLAPLRVHFVAWLELMLDGRLAVSPLVFPLWSVFCRMLRRRFVFIIPTRHGALRELTNDRLRSRLGRLSRGWSCGHQAAGAARSSPTSSNVLPLAERTASLPV